MKNVMFVCQDSSYSQIAAAWMRYFVKDAISVASAGLYAGHSIPNLVRVMDEVGLDISKNGAKLLSDYHPANFDVVISLCDRSMRLPEDWMLRQIYDEWILPKHEGKEIESYQQVRDEIKDRVDILLMRYVTWACQSK